MIKNNLIKFTWNFPKVASIFFLGFSSGIPFLLVLSTLSAWLHESKVSNASISYFVLVTTPYTFKFIIAPILENTKVPFLCTYLGMHRGWLLTIQAFLILSIIFLGMTNPLTNLYYTAFCAFLVSFFSACQDIVYESYRIKIISQNNSYGASFSMMGYRMGLLTSGAGSLYLSSYFSWCTVYILMACCILLGMITTLLSYEEKQKITIVVVNKQYLYTINKSYLVIKKSIYSFFKKQNWQLIFSFIFLYKIGITSINIMSIPFLIEIGFSKLEIAYIAKSFGIGSMFLGGMLGGMILHRINIFYSMFIWSILQFISNSMFILQAIIGYNIWLLTITIGIENLCCGIGEVMLIAYFSRLCSTTYTMTHYALMTSFGSFVRIIISLVIGIIVDQFTWICFYTLISLFSIPIIILFFRNNLVKHFQGPVGVLSLK